MITAERLREVLSYDPETGVFRWKIKPSRNTVIGSMAGTIVSKSEYAPRGRLYIGIEKKHYLAHRLAWLYVHGEWPGKDIDHVNGDTIDNRLSNLRLATKLQNMGNAKVRRHNKSGLKGVHHHITGRWVARIRINGQSNYLGIFGTKEEAHAAYMRAAKKHFGEFACDGRRA